MNQQPPFRIYRQPELKASSLVVGWTEDAGRLGPRVIDYLNRELGGEEFGEIEPTDFFPLSSVSVESDVAQFPESKFYSCAAKGLVTFKSSAPRFEWHRFLQSVLDVAEHYCHATEVYAIGGMVTMGPHTIPRELLGVANCAEMKGVLGQYSLATPLDYETPPDQKPTFNSFLLWVAMRRGLPGAGLWVPVPFYLAAADDPQAWRKMIDFLDRRLGLGIDLTHLDAEVARQNEMLAQLRSGSSDIDSCISKLESNQTPSDEENENLVREVQHLFSRRH